MDELEQILDRANNTDVIGVEEEYYDQDLGHLILQVWRMADLAEFAFRCWERGDPTTSESRELHRRVLEVQSVLERKIKRGNQPKH